MIGSIGCLASALLLISLRCASAFAPPSFSSGTTTRERNQQTQQPSLVILQSESTKNNEYLQNLSKENPAIGAEPIRNPNRPELPVVPGDYDWDAKFTGDDDWITGGAVPGRRVLNDIELAQQVTALGGLEEKWRKLRIQSEYEESINVGFVPTAETVNGRAAMFFLLTGLLTEYWTGISLPGQVEEMLRVAGIIGF
jgi:hypothetical protein